MVTGRAPTSSNASRASLWLSNVPNCSNQLHRCYSQLQQHHHQAADVIDEACSLRVVRQRIASAAKSLNEIAGSLLPPLHRRPRITTVNRQLVVSHRRGIINSLIVVTGYS